MRAPKCESRTRNSEAQVWKWLSGVPDPEIPILTVLDLGIVRGVSIKSDAVEVSVSPTYSGCPASEVIERDIVAKLLEKGVGKVSLKRVLSPPWSSDWISQAGREKLRAYGIAPPSGSAGRRQLLAGSRAIACPRCSAVTTTLVSEFGSTPCKASYKCDQCLEPFEYFKCI